MEQLLDKWQRLLKSEYLRPDEKLMLNHCIADLKRFMGHDVDANEMVDKQQTAVELLEEKLKISFGNDLKPLRVFFVIAKEMEKAQIIKAYQQGVTDEHGDTIMFTTEGCNYYNETYGDNK